MVLGRALSYVIDRTGAYLIPRAYRTFRRYDVQTTNALFGKSGGKGFRHGRDLGLILGEYAGDDLDELPARRLQPPYDTSRAKYQAHRGYKRKRHCRPSKYNRYRGQR